MSDSYICQICHLKVKTKLKRAHESSAKHRANVQKLNPQKRPAKTEVEEIVSAKKARPEPESIELDSVAVRRPDKEEETAPTSALPDNFFDKSASEKAAAASAQMDKEMEKFMKEVERLEQKEDDVEEKHHAILNDLEMIDEHIKLWNNLNELDKQKEKLILEARARVITAKNAPPEEEDDMDCSDDEFNPLDWRSRKI